MRWPRAGLWRHPDFLRLWAAQVVSAFGSRITRTALPVIVVGLGVPATQVALLAALQYGPGVLVALVVGGLVDRSRKRRLLVGADLVRALLVATLPIAAWTGTLTLAHIAIVAVGVGAASALFQIADNAYLPALIGKDQLVEGNAKLETTESIAEVAGPAAAGIMIRVLGAPVTVLVDAASYVWSAALLGRIRAAEPAPAPRIPGAAAGLVDDLRLGLRACFGHPLVRPTLVTGMVSALHSGFFLALYMLFALRNLRLDEATVGIIIGCGGIGALFGAVTARWLPRTLGLGRTLLVTAGLWHLSALLIPLADGPPWLIVGCLVGHQLGGDGFMVAYQIHAVSLRQTVLPHDVLGRANAAFHVCTAGVVLIGALIAGPLADVVGVRNAIWLGMVTGLLAPMFLWPLRHLDVMPPADAR